MDWSKFFTPLGIVGSDMLGGILGHFVISEMKGEKKVVTGLNMDAIRSHAPHFAKKLKDEAEFEGLLGELQLGQQKSLEVWMANLGRHQRADIILTICEMLARTGLEIVEARRQATTRLGQLATITPDVFKTRAAVAFNLMKASENDYLGAQLTEQASQALVWVTDELRQGKTEWDAWTNGQTDRMDVWTDGMRRELATRPRGFFATLRRMYDLPWERTR